MTAKVQILMFHRVLPNPDPLMPEVPDAREFESQMRVLRRYFNVLSLKDAVAGLNGGRIAPRSVCITFDDGYRDNLTVAAPILEKYELPATLFVASGFLDGGMMWNDMLIEAARTTPVEFVDIERLELREGPIDSAAARKKLAHALISAVKYLPLNERLEVAHDVVQRLDGQLDRSLMLDTPELRELAKKNFEIGAHTVNHPILARGTVESAREEIESNRTFLEEVLGRPVCAFAYPNGRPGGDYGLDHRNLVAELGFDYAVSTAWGTARSRDDRYQLPRLGFPGRRGLSFALRLYAARRDVASDLV